MDSRTASLADILERVLDKGVVIVGGVTADVVDIELLALRLRLFSTPAQTTCMGDPFFAPRPGRALPHEQFPEGDPLIFTLPVGSDSSGISAGHGIWEAGSPDPGAGS